MTDRPLGDSRLDAAIDRAVREMMGAEPRADLRERVLAELAGPSAHGTWWPRLALGSAGVAAAIVLLMLMVNRPAEPPADQTLAATAPPASVRGNAAVPPEPPKRTPPVRADGPTGRTLARTPVAEERPVQAASIDTSEPIAIEPMAAVERLAPIDPIRIARLEAPTVSEISITPITIERIEITPLTPQR